MSTEENPAAQIPTAAPIGPDPSAGPAWGAPLPNSVPPADQLETPTQVEVRPHWPASKVIAAVAIAAVIVGGGTAVAIAATTPSTAASTPTPTATGGFGRSGGFGGSSGYPGRGGAGGFAAGGALTDALHGDFVVQTNTGGYATERLQTGKVTKVDSTSISLTSADGYAGSYTITTSTLINRGLTKIDQVKKGDTVTVLATLSGTTATATTLTDAADAHAPSGTGTEPGTGAGSGTSGGSGGMQPNDPPTANGS
ncbi:MAG TPA: hypothetical protein VHX38_10490 [Pseudonocardiaceae bacterium]|nr:hypothetical protein [Pseudonocardiaceae bacterium]